MSGGYGKLTEVYEGFGGRGRRLCHPSFKRAKMNGLLNSLVFTRSRNILHQVPWNAYMISVD